jgi:hypothetical protein
MVTSMAVLHQVRTILIHRLHIDPPMIRHSGLRIDHLDTTPVNLCIHATKRIWCRQDVSTKLSTTSTLDPTINKGNNSNNNLMETLIRDSTRMLDLLKPTIRLNKGTTTNLMGSILLTHPHRTFIMEVPQGMP